MKNIQQKVEEKSKCCGVKKEKPVCFCTRSIDCEHNKFVCSNCDKPFIPQTEELGTTVAEEWEIEFRKQFGDLTLGLLVNGKNSPVFVNNDLELPRLKSFISSTIKSSIEEERAEIMKKVMDLQEKFPDHESDEYDLGQHDMKAKVVQIINK